MKIKESFCIAYGGNSASFIDATMVKPMIPNNGLDDIHKSKVKYDPSVDLIDRVIPKGSNKISVQRGNPIRCLKLGYDGQDRILTYLIMDMDNSYLAQVDNLNIIRNVTICKGYNPFSFLSKRFKIDESLLSPGNDFYRMPLSRSIYEFILHGGRYVILEGFKDNFVIAPTICKRKNIEDSSLYGYKILGSNNEEYSSPFMEYVNGQFARIIQIADGKKISIDEHDLKSDSEMRWVTNFRWPSVSACTKNLLHYGLVNDYMVSKTIKVEGCMSPHIFSFITHNSKIKSFIYDPVNGYMSLIL